MTSQFSPKVSEILAFSREEAARLASSSIGAEHILLGILRENDAPITNVLTRMNVNLNSIKTELEQRVRMDSIRQPINTSELVLNEKASNILKLAVLEARTQHTETVNVEHILLAILHDRMNNGAKEVLEFNNVNYEDTLTLLKAQKTPIKDGIDLPEDEDAQGIDNSENSAQNGTNAGYTTTTRERNSGGKTPILDNFSTDLTDAAAKGKLDPIVGREKQIQRVIEILGRRKKNNPVLIGEPGVGKTAIVEGLAQMIAKHKTSPTLFNKRVVNLDLTGIVAGTKYRGQFEERVRGLLKELEKNPDIIVFIDEIHTLVGAGSAPGSMDAANIMKPALARGTIQCIGATTLDEYRNSIEKDGALERRFQKVLVEPTSKQETLQILENIKDRYEQHHHVRYTDEALHACVNLTDRYVSDRFFPDKAIDVLDEVGSKVFLKHAKVPEEITNKEKELDAVKQKKQEAVRNQNFELAAAFRDKQTQLELELEKMNRDWTSGKTGERKTITAEDVEDVVSMMTGIPVQRIVSTESVRLKDLEKKLKDAVIAQDPAVTKVVKAIKRNRVGLREPNHPIGAFMFLGPTGVGKTYLAKKLAEYMFGSKDALIRIDMSEYTESFNVSRLVGAPPGYVGYEEGGQLTEQVRRHPYSIVLLDEIEKAHGNVYNLLLQMLDEGRLTDGNGRLVDFRNTVIIMTSNIGTKQLKEFGNGIGFNANPLDDPNAASQTNENARSIIQKSLSKKFAPEFLNRLDEIIIFEQLNMEGIKKIVNIELKGLFDRVKALGYEINITDKAKEFVAKQGYDIQYGARPLKRAIQTYIEDGLSEMILSDELTEGAVINIGKNPNQDKLTFKVSTAEATE